MPSLTVLQKLRLISDSVGADSDDLQFVDVASEFFMNSLPDQLAKDYYIPNEVDNDLGFECGTKYGYVVRDGIPCRQGIPAYEFLYRNANSSYQATKNDPVFIKKQGKVFIIPDPTVQEIGFVFAIPRNFISDYSSDIEFIPNTPSNAEHIILLYASFLLLKRKMKDLRNNFPSFPSTFDDTANTISISFPVIGSISVDTSLNFTDLDSLSLENISISDYDVDPAEISKAFDALQNAFRFVGEFNPDGGDTGTIPEGAFWLDDEDPEMVDSAVRLASQEVNRANSYFRVQTEGLQSYITAVNAAVTKYNAQVQQEIQKISAQVSKMQAEVQAKSLELQKHGLSIQQVQVELQKFQADVQQRLQKNNQILQRFSQEVASFNSEYQAIINDSVSVFQQYSTEFSKFLGAYEGARNN